MLTLNGFDVSSSAYGSQLFINVSRVGCNIVGFTDLSQCGDLLENVVMTSFDHLDRLISMRYLNKNLGEPCLLPGETLCRLRWLQALLVFRTFAIILRSLLVPSLS